MKFTDSLIEMNNLQSIKDIFHRFICYAQVDSDKHDEYLKDGRTMFARDSIKKIHNDFWKAQNAIIAEKRKVFEEMLAEELFRKKVQYLCNGVAFGPDPTPEVAEGLFRGWITVSQHREEDLIAWSSRPEFEMSQIVDHELCSFRPYLYSESISVDSLDVGLVLFKVLLNGRLERIGAKYDTTD